MGYDDAGLLTKKMAERLCAATTGAETNDQLLIYVPPPHETSYAI